MEIHQVRYFVAVAKHLNFTRAAEACHISQPALTKGIQRLEQLLGGDLIIRERQFTQLTGLGKLVLPGLEQLLAAAEAVQTAARDHLTRDTSPLRIGLTRCVSPEVFSVFLANLAEIVPELHVELVDLLPLEGSRQLFTGELQAVVSEVNDGLPDRVDRMWLFNERFVVLMPREHPLAGKPSVPIADLAEQSWLRRADCSALDALWAAVLPGGPEPHVLHRGRQEQHLQALVAAGLGVLLAGEMVPVSDQIVARPIEGDPLVQRVELHTLAGRRHVPALDALVKLARAYNWGGWRPMAETARRRFNLQAPIIDGCLPQHLAVA